MRLATVYRATYFEALTLRVILEGKGFVVFIIDVEVKTADPTMTGYPCFDTTVCVPSELAEEVGTWIREKWRPWRFAATKEDRRSTVPRRVDVVGRSIRWASYDPGILLLTLWRWSGYMRRARRAPRWPLYHRLTVAGILFQGSFSVLLLFLWLFFKWAQVSHP